jgi:hypothetical protein
VPVDPTMVPFLVNSPVGIVPHGSRPARDTAAACVTERDLTTARSDAVEKRPHSPLSAALTLPS